MTPGMLKMWVSFISIGLMILAIFSIYLSRNKIKNKFYKILLAIPAYIFMFLAGILMLYVVLSGPVSG